MIQYLPFSYNNNSHYNTLLVVRRYSILPVRRLRCIWVIGTQDAARIEPVNSEEVGNAFLYSEDALLSKARSSRLKPLVMVKPFYGVGRRVGFSADRPRPSLLLLKQTARPLRRSLRRLLE